MTLFELGQVYFSPRVISILRDLSDEGTPREVVLVLWSGQQRRCKILGVSNAHVEIIEGAIPLDSIKEVHVDP